MGQREWTDSVSEGGTTVVTADEFLVEGLRVEGI